ncbi:Protein IWS1 homolog [Strongyloides ratti]|uniref:Protein IWS1 homolog n=1 Tax=Strongyloides ratti TaxID=34506 RepID=A0A090MZL7_STRRB|nr:Protein IWS1 homolog [Strongyloides ratti]CEF69154.1 Protein IWS1 homolog [Strongyloides ratti]
MSSDGRKSSSKSLSPIPRNNSLSEGGSSPKTQQEVREFEEEKNNQLFGDVSDSDDDGDDEIVINRAREGSKSDEERKSPSLLADEDPNDGVILSEEEERPRIPGFASDFDEMIARRKALNKSKRKRKNDDLTLLNHYDDQIRDLMYRMVDAAKEDIDLNRKGLPAPNKLMMLNDVKSMLLAQERYDQLIDNGFFGCISQWLTPLPNQALPSIQIRTSLIKLLHDYYKKLDTSSLKASGLGKAVMFLSDHPEETYENKKYARRLIRAWMEPIFAAELEEKGRQMREKREKEALKEAAKRRRLSKESEKNPEREINRARVPQFTAREYLHRPSANFDATVPSTSRGGEGDRFSKLSKSLQDRSKTNKGPDRMVKVSIEGRRM